MYCTMCMNMSVCAHNISIYIYLDTHICTYICTCIDINNVCIYTYIHIHILILYTHIYVYMFT